MNHLQERLARSIQDLQTSRSRRELVRRQAVGARGFEELHAEVTGGVLALRMVLDARYDVIDLSLLASREVLWSVQLLPAPRLGAGGAAGGAVAYVAEIDLCALAGVWNARPDVVDVAGDGAVAAGTLRLTVRIRSRADQVQKRALAVEFQTEDGTYPNGRQFMAMVNGGVVDADAEVLSHVPLGRCGLTVLGRLDGVGGGAALVAPYVNRNGYLALAVGREARPTISLGVDSIDTTNAVLCLRGRAYTGFDKVASSRFQLIGRRSGNVLEGPSSFGALRDATARNFGRGRYLWEAVLDFATVDWDQLDTEDNYDLWVELLLEGREEPVSIRVAKTPYVVRATTRAGHLIRGGEVLVLNPYYTFKRKATSLLIERFSLKSFTMMRESGRVGRALAKRGNKPIWIIGELPYKAQDNGLYFFRYVREHHPEIDAYYVINQGSPELDNLRGLGHVVFHHSEEHFRLALLADRFIGTHHPDYLYPTRMPEFRSKATGYRVFLQHGVMGTKWMVPNYGKRSTSFETDLFCVSSEREKEYIVGDFGYSPREVVVTGLPRFDSLLAGDVDLKPRQLLVIPTWRDWLQTDAAFGESEYLRLWSDFLNHPRLLRLAETENVEVVFCLHPNMQGFTSYFEHAPARIVRQGETDVQFLMKQSAAMVTDYSSVGFDFSFLGRPVHYLQFDRGRFLGKAGSHLDLDSELPGPVALDLAALFDQLEATVRRGFAMEPEYRERSDRFIVAKDLNHSKRVFEAVAALQVTASPVEKIAKTEFAERLLGRLRRSKRYFSVMKAMQRGLQKLPMDSRLMVFESGLGKQYADSPRYIYEELVRRGDARKKVWIYDGPRHFADPNTTVVKRLSPQYFWVMGRAKYWVSNQSFPYYMTRRKRGVYLQTWHGTPLKRMLHDIGEIQGRDPGYVERVERATAQWTHLLSPSPYATAAMRSSYGYTGPVLELGYPRNDPLVADSAGEKASQVRRGLGIAPGQRVVLYAPTFRDNASNGRGRFGFEMPFDLAGFTQRFGDDTVLLLRMHVLVQAGLEIPPECRGKVIDVSGYPEIQELYLASDVLITDYSSVFFDYALLRRPIVFYAYDLEVYRDELRGFYLDYAQEMPGPIVESEDALFAALQGALDGDLQDGGRREEFLARFAPRDDGSASARVVEALFESS
ncbi:CDP-glycerol glycerophosphotransferase family protein [Paeniglutamicibacter cryotolerans]|uniref:CDP-glycerol glycerophosphotransferase n=1 Tax=Paeniglutamicibacter cryotolerans TaxID=670079 RepID=A0A839QRK7_9MICC|nr:CDP-glycerol glycerophosphotransferase family protein [Paeniglutamicibacter cryotolerans]MBB2997414.1 CDP-glycerol glycerophosphotransferase [Paeniglutamicibacter cryotolerans]